MFRYPTFFWIAILSAGFALGAVQADGAEYFCPSGDTECLVNSVALANETTEADVIRLEKGRYLIAVPMPDSHLTRPEGVGLFIRRPLTIEGNGATIERDAAAAPFGILESIGPLELSNLTLRGGNSSEYGGAITSWKDMTIKDCVIEENESRDAGAIYQDATMRILGTSIRRNSSKDVFGAIWNFSGGRMLIQDSVIDKNTGYYHGAFSNEEVLVVVNSTISRNAASSESGTGVGYFNCSTIFTNSTLIDNSGGRVGGPYIINGLCDSPENESGFQLINSILTGNSGGDANDCMSDPRRGGDLTSEGHNVFGDLSQCTATLHLSDKFVDPMLGSFVDDGTPGFGHYPPLNGSPAVDRGDNTSCTSSDQIGNPRHDGDGDGVVVCDIGAVEYQGERYDVGMDFKPGNRRNVINVRSLGRVWVAILSDLDFDALQVDPRAIQLGADHASPERYRVKDVNRDRLPDLMLRFRTPEVGLQCGDTEVELMGETYAGDSIIGTDKVKTVGCKKKPKKGKKK